MPPKHKVHDGESSKGKAPAVKGEGSAPRPVDDFTQLLQQQVKVHGEQIQQLLEMQRTTHEQAQAQDIVHRHVPVQTEVYDRFRRFNPPEFMGSNDPAVAKEWIKSLESIFSYLYMEDADKVTCAIFLLTKHARIWWENARMALPAIPLTWETFKTVFYNKYFSKDVRAKKASDFLNLKQRTMSMIDYIQQFEAGIQYVPYIAQDDTSKGEHFMRGLCSKIKRDVRMSKVVTYGEIVERALMAEQDEQDIDRDRQQRRQKYFQKSQGTGQSKKTDNRGTRPEESRDKGPPPCKEQDRPPCPKCGKLHGGECMQGYNVCYRCKKPGHLARNCPGSSEKVQGCFFSMTKEKVDADTSMINGMFWISGITAIVLLDSGATYSFILELFVRRLGITASTTETQLAIALPSGQELQTNQIVRGCPIYVQGHQVYADLIVLRMTDFDVILGMDWLSKYRVSIHCGIKMIKFAPVGAEPFTVASAEVFSDDVTGLPPDKEIEFELLDKGFIRPSFSPWGEPVLFVKKKDETLELALNLSYEERPVQILDRKSKVLRGKEISLVKLLWRNHAIEEATWEREDEIQQRYPELYGTPNLEDEIL
ncbi:uncharacterized protein LOC142525862 [Primulina tabacum]|uniref:uncharacterized protein LOC142525862 n=1 Tax=Primulina tabacum TaxID=48773 RepID=UPI003F5ABA99